MKTHKPLTETQQTALNDALAACRHFLRVVSANKGRVKEAARRSEAVGGGSP